MMMVVITRTRLIATQYQEWHAKNLNKKNPHTRIRILGTEGALVKKYDRAAGTMGRGEEYGMAASDDDEAKAETEVVEDYALSMQLSNQNAMLQQQLQQQQQAINQLQQQAMYVNSRNNNNNGNKSNNNNDNNNNRNGRRNNNNGRRNGRN